MNKAWIKMRREKIVKLLSGYQQAGTLTVELANGLAGALSELEIMDNKLDLQAKKDAAVDIKITDK